MLQKAPNQLSLLHHLPRCQELPLHPPFVFDWAQGPDYTQIAASAPPAQAGQLVAEINHALCDDQNRDRKISNEERWQRTVRG